jgi:hypothetical protein
MEKSFWHRRYFFIAAGKIGAGVIVGAAAAVSSLHNLKT